MKILKSVISLINQLIEWFYPYFQRFLPKETFKYAFCGGSNTALDLFLYFITYNFILQKHNLELGFITISPHIAALFMVFPFTFSMGFFLSKYVTFTQSELRGRIQLFRYGVIVMGSIILNYLFLKLFVDVCGFYPSPSKLLTTAFIVIYSYLSQRHFTFRTKKVISNNYSTIESID